VASNFPTTYVRVTSQTYVLQHISLRQIKGYLAKYGFCPSSWSAGVGAPTSQADVWGVFGFLWVDHTQGFMYQGKCEDLHNKQIPNLHSTTYDDTC